MKKNELVNLKITDTTLQGSGVAKHDGFTVFVNSAVTGDEVEAHILKVKQNCAFAKIEKIITPSDCRVEPLCPSYPKCGGCGFRHISYKTELSIKENNVKNVLKRIGGVEPSFEPIFGLNPDGYRNKAQYPVSFDGKELKIGFFADRTHRVVDCPVCRLQPDEFEKGVAVFRRFLESNNISVYDEERHKGLMRHIYFRLAVATGEIMVCIVINGESLPFSDILTEQLKEVFGERLCSVVLNINREKTNVIMGKKCVTLYGKDTVTDILCGVKVRISPLSFYQVNHDVAEKLYEKAAEFAEPSGKTVLDLYCGAGTIGLSMADRAKSVIGVEIVPEAVADAKVNAAENGADNARFICADAAAAAESLKSEGVVPDVVILDPPRKGCSEELIKTVACDFAPERVVYVSCDPATLARDCKRFSALGYKTVTAAPFDMFPRTAHCECVCLLKRV